MKLFRIRKRYVVMAVYVIMAIHRADAQTIGPSPTPYTSTPEGTPPPTDPGWTPSPTPGPSPTPVPYVFTADPNRTPIPVDASGLYEGLIEGNNNITGLNPDLSAPAGIELLPNVDGREIFRYAKWLLSPSSADELVGPFAPLIVHTGIFITLLIGVGMVYAIVYAAIYIIRFVVWIFRLIVQVIQAIVSVIGSIFKFFF